MKDMRVDYPVAIDNDYALWDAFSNQYWPALYSVDVQGQVRHHYFGEGAYEQSEMIMLSPMRSRSAEPLQPEGWSTQ